MLHRIASAVLALSCLTASAESAADASKREFFESRIRPVLVEHCYGCHNSADNAEAGLAVDWRQGLLESDVVVPGDPEASQLLAVIKHEIDGVEMPEGGAKLEDSVIADFETWIRQGAFDPRDQPPSADEITAATSWDATLQRRKQWWSWQPIQAVTPPPVTGQQLQPVDRFIHARLKAEDLQPAPPAAAPVLVRRLYLVLIGLPPTPEQFAEWTRRIENDGQVAVEELVDQLLASPHFGERWARHWMDWIRYAESHGSEGDPPIHNAWVYRDYLIRALNADVPYDQLLREHVAGDLLSNPRVDRQRGINESAIGVAHLRMVFHGFAPTDALDEKVRFIDDTVNTFSKAFLGMTVSCARCHDHKFDAISQSDYYAMFGIFAACRPAREVIDLPQRVQANRDELVQLKTRIREAVAEDWHRQLGQLRKRLQSHRWDEEKSQGVWQPLATLDRAADAAAVRDHWQQSFGQQSQANPVTDKNEKSWQFGDGGDWQSWYKHGAGLADQPSQPGQFAVAIDGQQALQGIYPAGVYSHLVSSKHPARLTSPDHVLGQDEKLWVRVQGDGQSQLRYAVQDYPRSGTVFPVRTLKPEWEWMQFDLSYWAGDSMHVELVTALDAPLLVKDQPRSWFGVREVRILPKDAPAPRSPSLAGMAIQQQSESPPESYRQFVQRYVLAIEKAIEHWRSGEISDAEAELLDEVMHSGWLPNRMDDLPTAKPLLQQYRRLEAEVPVPTRVPGLDETTGREQPLYVRGNHKQLGDIVPRRFLEAIDDQPYRSAGSGRLELADDLLRDDNPLTRRVIVNRVWHHVFGRGLVLTADNFGRLGEKPSHPELLDYLAIQFSEQGWSLKNLIRTMVTSRTWQQSSTPSQQTQRLDPDNRLLSHANLRRMEAEVIRDSLLAAAGQLQREPIGGEPVDGESNRRSVYVRVIRNSLDPFLRAFDFPEPFSTTGRRDVTNVPAQSLTIMNSPRVAQYAQSLAQQVMQAETPGSSAQQTESRDADEGRLDAQRIERLFVRLLSRQPSPQELQRTQQYLGDTRRWLQQHHLRRQQLQQAIDRQQQTLTALLQPLRDRLSGERSAASESESKIAPLASWDFDHDFKDQVGSLHGQSHGDVRLEDGALVLSGGYVTTGNLNQPVAAKTLEAWVRLDNLDQRGGGVITLQTARGGEFDSIVFGEQQTRHWLAGSDHFKRTKPFGGQAEDAADGRYVHVAIVYQADGLVRAYRDGKPYGKPYHSGNTKSFAANEAIVTFGVRHLPPGGNRLLQGRIDQANLYDRALSDEQIAASFRRGTDTVTQTQLLAAMTPQQRSQFEEANQRVRQLRQQLDALPPLTGRPVEQAVWTDLAHAMLTLKEFIYVQ